MIVSPTNWLLLGVNVLMTVLAQACLREGMRRAAQAGMYGELPLPLALWKIGTNRFVIGGMAAFGASLILWLTLLSRIKLSVLYPIQQSAIFVLLQFVAWKWLGEGMPPARLLGVAVICVGVYWVARVG